MWFNSYSFVVFLSVVLCGHALLGHKWRNRWLLMCSYFFYGCWDWRFLGLILFTTGFEFVSSRKIAATTDAVVRRRWLTASLVVELSILAAFKYLGFFVAELHLLLAVLGLTDSPSWTLHILLPAGISFFTFQALSCTLDVFRRQTAAPKSFGDFALFISFFPQLVAGPIERSSLLLPQVENPRPRLDSARFQAGLYHVLTGFFKKVVIADNMAWLAGHVFQMEPSAPMTGLEVLLGVYAFAFQIYGDFSGYSSIAIGVATWLGFDLMENFRRPYFATSPTVFWSRWHISLSTWLRDYLYIPLGGNRGGKWKTGRNLMVTMLLGGLWHGANWTFLAWGGLHGAWLMVHRWLSGAERKATVNGRTWWAQGGRLLLTFHLVCLGWLFFRAETFGQAGSLLGALVEGGWGLTDYARTTAALLGFFLVPWVAYEVWVERAGAGDDLALLKKPWYWRAAVYLYLLVMLVFFPAPVPAEFIYFRF